MGVKTINKEAMAIKEAYGRELLKLGEVNEKVVVLDADLAKPNFTIGYKGEFPDRFFDMGVSEQDLMGTAAGLASCGLIPFATTFTMFAAGRAYEQIRNSIAYPNFNVKVVGVHGGLGTGPDGASHQCLEDLSLMRTIPNMTVIVPVDPNETAKAVRAIAAYEGPVYLRVGRDALPNITADDAAFTIGKAVRMKDGRDVTIFATGIMVHKALEVSEALQGNGISARVVNIHTIKPIDREEIVKAASETGKIVTIEDHNIIGGLGSAVSEIVAENCPVPVMRLGVRDTFGQSGFTHELFEHYGLGNESIREAIVDFVGSSK